MKNRTLRMLALTGALVLLPVQTWAAVCFNVVRGVVTDVVVIEVVGQAGPFFSLVGEALIACGTGTNSMPLSGSAHVRSDGKAHFGISISSLTVPSGLVAPCVPVWIQGTLDPPAFNTGTGVVRFEGSPSAAFPFTAASCPPLPQMVD